MKCHFWLLRQVSFKTNKQTNEKKKKNVPNTQTKIQMELALLFLIVILTAIVIFSPYLLLLLNASSTLFSFFFFFFYFFTNSQQKISGWEAKCLGQSSALTTQLFRISESETDTLIALDTPTTTMENSFLGFSFDYFILKAKAFFDPFFPI